jgi:hypothetical protein
VDVHLHVQVEGGPDDEVRLRAQRPLLDGIRSLGPYSEIGGNLPSESSVSEFCLLHCQMIFLVNISFYIVVEPFYWLGGKAKFESKHY